MYAYGEDLPFRGHEMSKSITLYHMSTPQQLTPFKYVIVGSRRHRTQTLGRYLLEALVPSDALPPQAVSIPQLVYSP
jgi:hypothetical protein